MTCALDTGAIICLLDQDRSVTMKRNEAVLAGVSFIIPPVVDYEIQRGLFYKPSPKKERIYFALRSHYGVGDMTTEMWVQAAHIYVNLRQKGFTVGDDDIYIAAFCLVNRYALVTRNTKDFENIAGLHIEDWTGQYKKSLLP